jgi:NTP pyrophosphatase (non-canonical NTP hydrolase)
MGEIGEFLMKYDTGCSEDEIVDEAGDLCWYCANLCSDLGISLSEEYHRLQGIDGLISRGGVVGLWNESLVGMGCVICERVKKILRDGDPDGKKKAEVGSILGRIVKHIEILGVGSWGVSLERIMERNLRKLSSRAKRGVLHGDGDQR